MSTEQKYSLFGVLINLILVFFQIIGGILLCSYTLICNGYYSLCNLSMHYLTHIAENIRGRKVNMKTPFGVGKLEFSSSCLIGVVFVAMAIYVFEKSFYLNYSVVNNKVFILISLLFIFKYVNMTFLYNVGKNTRSQMLIEVAQNTYMDLIITIIPLVIAILSFIDKRFDLIGCLVISLIIFYKGIKIIRYNFIMLRGQNDTSNAINSKIAKVVNSYENIKFLDVSLVNVKNYYSATISIEVNDGISMIELLKIERSISKKIRNLKVNVKLIDYEEYLIS